MQETISLLGHSCPSYIKDNPAGLSAFGIVNEDERNWRDGVQETHNREQLCWLDVCGRSCSVSGQRTTERITEGSLEDSPTPSPNMCT